MDALDEVKIETRQLGLILTSLKHLSNKCDPAVNVDSQS